MTRTYGLIRSGAGGLVFSFYHQHLSTHWEVDSLLNSTYKGTKISSDHGINLQDTPPGTNSQTEFLWGRLLDLLSDIVQIVVFCNHCLGTTFRYPWVRLQLALLAWEDVL